MQEFKPTFIVAVPRAFEKVRRGGRGASKGRRSGSSSASAVAIDYSKQARAGAASAAASRPSTRCSTAWCTASCATLGGRLRFALSGGAPSESVWGTSSTAPACSSWRGTGSPRRRAVRRSTRPTTSASAPWPAAPGAPVRIAEDGEILLKGGHIFRGYWDNPEATAEVLADDGWFATGDIGVLDDSGLRITGRKKDLIVRAGGKNVALAVLEDLVRSDRIISQCVVVGDAKPFIACLVTLDAEEPRVRRAARTGLDGGRRGPPSRGAGGPEGHRPRQRSGLGAEAIKAFRILPGDFSIESGELTPSMKVIRPKVLARHADVINEIYSS